jgi:hypothetical protein
MMNSRRRKDECIKIRVEKISPSHLLRAISLKKSSAIEETDSIRTEYSSPIFAVLSESS